MFLTVAFAKDQKMLIVDEAVVPQKSIFDYKYTVTMPKDFTMDGALDGIAHCLEVYMGCPEEVREKAKPVCLLGIEMVVQNVKKAIENPEDLDVREALGLATDLGGYGVSLQ